METKQTPLRTAIMRIMSDMFDSADESGIYETGVFMDRIEQLMCDMMAAPEVMQLSGSEAVMGFMAWLSTRSEATVFGSTAAVDLSLYERFVEANNLKTPREAYYELLIHPEELAPEPGPAPEPTILEELEAAGYSCREWADNLGAAVESMFKFDLKEPDAPKDCPKPEREGRETVMLFDLDGKIQAKGSLEHVLSVLLKLKEGP